MADSKRLPAFEKFIQGLRAAWAELADVEARMKKGQRLLEELVNDQSLREASKTWPSTEGRKNLLFYEDLREAILVGHSYGGKWALFAAALWDKFAAVAVSDPGIVFDETRANVNYWEPWYLGLEPAMPSPKPGIPSADKPRTGAYKRMKETGRDLHELHALLAPRPFLVSGGAEDPPARWLALNHLVALNRLLGYTNRVAMTSRPEHSPNEESNAQLYAFFESFLNGH